MARRRRSRRVRRNPLGGAEFGMIAVLGVGAFLLWRVLSKPKAKPGVYDRMPLANPAFFTTPREQKQYAEGDHRRYQSPVNSKGQPVVTPTNFLEYGAWQAEQGSGVAGVGCDNCEYDGGETRDGGSEI